MVTAIYHRFTHGKVHTQLNQENQKLLTTVNEILSQNNTIQGRMCSNANAGNMMYKSYQQWCKFDLS